MKKLTALKKLTLLAMVMASAMVFAQPDNDITIIFVGDAAGTPLPEDQVAIDSLSQWVDILYYSAAEFNAATADELYSTSGFNASGIIISESINSATVPNFGNRDLYPVPAIVMEGVFGTPDNPDKWPLIKEEFSVDGGIWGYGTPEDVDVQWKIANNENYITQNFSVGDIINYADEAERGVPYIHGIDYEHVILATAARESGGDVTDFVQSEAIALGYIVDPEILYMNVAYTYLAVASKEFYDILHRGVLYVFDLIPVGVDQVRTKEFGLSVYPSPAVNDATLRFSAGAGQEVSVDLYNLSGALVNQVYRGVTMAGENEISLSTSEYARGLYMVKLQIGNKVSSAKLVLK